MDVTIAGSNLAGATGVSFGSGITVNGFSVQSPTSIVASITIDCWAAAGPRTVLVTTPTGTGALEGGFTVQSANLTSIEPSRGGQGQTLDVTIHGICLAGAIGVSLGPGVTVNSFTVQNPAQITARITIECLASPGPRDVVVATPGGVGVLAGGFTVQGAPISSVKPDRGCRCESLDVTINGTCFTGAQAVSFGPGITVNSFVVRSWSELVVSIAIDCTAQPGARQVAVTTSTGAISQPGTFTVNGVHVASAEPDRACRCDTQDVVVVGGCFAGATDVSLGPGIVVNGFSVVSPEWITASISVDCAADLGGRAVFVTTPAGTGVLVGGFSVESTTVQWVEPAEGRQGETLPVVIGGTCFGGATGISFGQGITVNGFIVDSPTQITAVVTIDFLADLGARDVTVTALVGSGTLPNAFNVMPIPLLGSWVWSGGYGGGTFDPETGALLSGSFTVFGNATGDLSGGFTGIAVYVASERSWHSTEKWPAATLTVDGVPHPALSFGEGMEVAFGPPGDTPCFLWGGLVTGKGGGFTTDGSNIYGHGTSLGAVSCIMCVSRETGTWSMWDLSGSGSWTGVASGLAFEPEVVDVTPGQGTVVLMGPAGMVADLRYSTTGAGTFALAQYGGNPGGTPPRLTLGKYIEADSDIGSSQIAWPLELRVYYTDVDVVAAGIEESTLRMYRWDGSAWAQVADSGVNTLEKYVWAMLTTFSPYAPMGDPLCPDWDVNCDGCTDILDIVLVGQHFGEAGSTHWIREDVNRDAVVSVLDVVLIGQHFGEGCTP